MIHQRIEDAIILAGQKRNDGVVISIFIAAAATARLRYPRGSYTDRDSFQKFILDEMGTITGGPAQGVKFYFDGNYDIPLERILYEFMRCKLVHEGYMPVDFNYTEPVKDEGQLYNVVSLHGRAFGLPMGWIWNLARAIMQAPENQNDFAGKTFTLPADYPANAGIKLDYPDDDPRRTGIDD